MKKKSAALLSSCAAIAVCSSLIVGSTYALFTSESKVNIAVTSGKIEVVAEVDTDSLKTYSFEQEQSAGVFENGGTAGFDSNSVLTLNNITPGDGTTFDIKVVNNSTVNVKYRVNWSVSGELAEVLEAEVDGTNMGLWSDWAIPATDSDKEKTVSVSVALPEEVGNDYQDKTAEITFAVEAVQGNAEVSNIEQGVELNVTYDPEFIQNGTDAENRIKCANELLSKESYATLADAKTAVSKLFNSSGNYSGSHFNTEQNREIAYSSAGPLHFYEYERQNSYAANARPISKIEYIVHGTVDAGAESIRLDCQGETATPEIVLRGYGNGAKLDNISSVSAFVSGGHEYGFVKEGSLTVSNIEFTETEKVTINATLGNYAYHNDNVTELTDWATTVNIENCKFNAQFYNYMHYDNELQREVNVNIKGCEFVKDEACTQTYAYFIQGYATYVLFENNTVSGYPRGINFQTQFAKECNVVIRGNTIGNNTVQNKNVIQLTTASTFLVEGNTINTSNGNAITLHESLGKSMQLDSIVIRNNIVNAKYFIYSEAEEVVSGKVTVEGNSGTIANAGLQHDGSNESESRYLLK